MSKMYVQWLLLSTSYMQHSDIGVVCLTLVKDNFGPLQDSQKNSKMVPLFSVKIHRKLRR